MVVLVITFLFAAPEVAVGQSQAATEWIHKYQDGVLESETLVNNDTTSAAYIRNHWTQYWASEGWTLETWGDSVASFGVVDTTFWQERHRCSSDTTLSFSAWATVDTVVLAAGFGSPTVHYFQYLNPFTTFNCLPYQTQFRAVTKDASGKIKWHYRLHRYGPRGTITY